MAVNTKENDWLVTMMNNPDVSDQSLYNNSITPENTQLLSLDDYKKSPYIQRKFSDDAGNLDEVKLKLFYEAVSKRYQNFCNKTLEDTFIKNYTYDSYNELRPRGSKTTDVELSLLRETNPLHIKTGVGRIGYTESPERTAMSVAESAKVYNYADKKFEDYSPNDMALFENPLRFVQSIFLPLVLSTWESDGYHTDQWTGAKVKHTKGSPKTNAYGEYYYETLDGRDPYGKLFRTISDNITSEDSALNKYDFFDSNDLTKSSIGTALKLTALLIPLAHPTVRMLYSYALLGSSLASVLPNLYNVTFGQFVENDSIVKTLNGLYGFGETLKPVMSEEGKKTLFGWENIANIIAESALLWALQRAIFNVVNKVSGTASILKKAFEEAVELAAKSQAGPTADAISMAALIKNNKLLPLLKSKNLMAANISLGYMATMLGLDVYLDALAQGATKALAAIWTWGSIAGMFAIDKTGLGEIFFPELRLVENEVAKKAVGKLSLAINDGFANEVKKAGTGKFGLSFLWNKAKEKSAGFWKDVLQHTTTFLEKSFAEGLEEVGEELVVDLAKSTNNALIGIGWIPKEWEWTKLNAFDNAGDRYLANFVGGAIGGAIFAGIDLLLNLKNSELTNQELIYLIRNGRILDVRDAILEAYEKKVLGNVHLSAIKGTLNEDNSISWESGTKDDNQNEAAYKMLMGYVNALEQAIHTDGLDYSDEELIDKMLMGDARVKQLLGFDEGGSLMTDGYMGTMLQDWQNLSSRILSLDGRIEKLNAKYSDMEKRRDPLYQKELEDLLKEKEELIKLKDKYLDGTYSKEYLEQTLFDLNPRVNKFFFAPNFSMFAESLNGQPLLALSLEMIENAKSKYQAFLNNTKFANRKEAFKLFKFFSEKLAKNLGEEGGKYAAYHQYKTFIESVFKDTSALELALKAIDNVRNPNDLAVLLEEALKDPKGGYTIAPKIGVLVVPKIPIDPNESLPLKTILLEDGSTRLETEEEFYDRVKSIEEYNDFIVDHVLDIIQRIKETGYIDDDVRDGLRKLLNAKKLLLDDINQTILPGIIDVFGLNNYNYEQINLLSSRIYEGMSDEDFLELMKNDKLNTLTLLTLTDPDLYIPEIPEGRTYSDLEGDPFAYWTHRLGVTDYLFNIDEDSVDLDRAALTLRENLIDFEQSKYTDLELTDLKKKEIEELVDLKLLSIKHDILEGLYNQFSSLNSQIYIRSHNEIFDLDASIDKLTLNPLKTILDDISVNAFGKKLSIFDILEREQNEIKKAESTGSYSLPSSAEQEIDLAVQVLVMARAVILASSTDTLGVGHNAIINTFIKEYFPKDLTYGEMTEGNVSILLDHLLEYGRQLAFLKTLSYMNKANAFAELKRVGDKTVRLLARAMYAKLKSIDTTIGGVQLTTGIDSIDMKVFDDDGDNSKLYLEFTKFLQLLHKNFKTMIESGMEQEKVLDLLFDDIGKKYNETDLVDLRTSKINGSINSITDYDNLILTIASLVFDKAEFNVYLELVLTEENNKFAPLVNLQLAAFEMTALRKNPKAFETVLKKITSSRLLPNYGYVDGLGGAGKSSVVAYLTHAINSKITNNSTVWIAGPKSTLIKNIRDALRLAENPSNEFTPETLLKKCLNAEVYSEIKAFMESGSLDNKYYKIAVVDKESVVVLNLDEIKFNEPASLPSSIIIDEATHIGKLTHAIISAFAKKHNITVTALGDLLQNGIQLTSLGYGNIDPTYTYSVRSPRLEISMRVNNVLKRNNITSLLYVSELCDTELKLSELIALLPPDPSITLLLQALARSEKVIKENFENFKKNFAFHYYPQEDGTLNGDKVVDSVTMSDVLKLLGTEDNNSVIIITDDENGELAKAARLYMLNNPTAKLKIYSPIDVQGLEGDYTIVDVKWDTSNIHDFCKNLYTLVTRSKKGSLIKDNGLTTEFKGEGGSLNTEDPSTGESPDPTEIIKAFRDDFLNILDDTNKKVPPLDTRIKPNTGNSSGGDGSGGDTPGGDNSGNGGDTPGGNGPGSGNGSGDGSGSGSGQGGTGEGGNGLGNNLGNDSSGGVDGMNPGNYGGVDKPVVVIEPGEGTLPEPPLVNDPLAGTAQMDPKVVSDVKPLILNNANSESSTDSEFKALALDVRQYGFYFRTGAAQSLTGNYAYDLVINKNMRGLDDLNIFFGDNPHMSKTKALAALNVLDALRELILTGAYKLILLDKKDILDIMPLFYLYSVSGSLSENLISTALGNLIKGFLGMTFALRVKRYNADTDKCARKLGYKADLEKGNSVSYNIVAILPKGNKKLEITLGAATSPDTWQKWIDSIPSSDGAYKKQMLTALDTYRADIYDKHSNIGNDEVIYYNIPEENITYSQSTRITKVLDADLNPIEFGINELLLNDPRLVISAPYIFSGHKIDDFKVWYKNTTGISLNDEEAAKAMKKLTGKAIAFATTAPLSAGILYSGGSQITSENIALAYNNLRLTEEGKPLIRMVMLSPKSIFAFDTMDPSLPGKIIPGFLSSKVTIEDEDGNKKPVDNQISFYGSNTTAARTLVTMWNYRSVLNDLMTVYNSLSSNNSLTDDLIVEELNKFAESNLLAIRILDSNGKYRGEDISSNVAPHLRSRHLTSPASSTDKRYLMPAKGNRLILGSFTSLLGLKILYNILDAMLDYCCALVPELNLMSYDKDSIIPKTTRLSNSSSNPDVVTSQSLTESFRRARKEGGVDTIKLIDKDGNVLTSFNNTSVLGSLMVALSRLIDIASLNISSDRGRSAWNIVVKSYDKEGKASSLVLFQLDAFHELVELIFASYGQFGEKYINKGEFIESMFNLILHGRCQIYSKNTGKLQGGTTQYAPFVNGFYYRSKYNYTKKDPTHVANFYPCNGTTDDYRIDAALERGVFGVGISALTLLKPDLDQDSVMTEDNFSEKLKGILDDNFPFILERLEIIDAALMRFRNEGERGVPNIILEAKLTYTSTIEKILHTDHELILSGLDFIIDFKGGAGDYKHPIKVIESLKIDPLTVFSVIRDKDNKIHILFKNNTYRDVQYHRSTKTFTDIKTVVDEGNTPPNPLEGILGKDTENETFNITLSTSMTDINNVSNISKVLYVVKKETLQNIAISINNSFELVFYQIQSQTYTGDTDISMIDLTKAIQSIARGIFEEDLVKLFIGLIHNILNPDTKQLKKGTGLKNKALNRYALTLLIMSSTDYKLIIKDLLKLILLQCG